MIMMKIIMIIIIVSWLAWISFEKLKFYLSYFEQSRRRVLKTVLQLNKRTLFYHWISMGKQKCTVQLSCSTVYKTAHQRQSLRRCGQFYLQHWSAKFVNNKTELNLLHFCLNKHLHRSYEHNLIKEICYCIRS